MNVLNDAIVLIFDLFLSLCVAVLSNFSCKGAFAPCQSRVLLYQPASQSQHRQACV